MRTHEQVIARRDSYKIAKSMLSHLLKNETNDKEVMDLVNSLKTFMHKTEEIDKKEYDAWIKNPV